MILENQDLEVLCDLALSTAIEAGQLIQSRFCEVKAIDWKSSGTSRASQIVTDVDLASDDLIYERLRESCRRYDLGYLSEERMDDGSRLVKDYFWCVDPLDGTLPFTEGREGYAVSIGLVSRSGESHMGVVYNPYAERSYCAWKGSPLWVNQCSWTLSLPAGEAKHIDRGGSVMNACWVLEEAPAYFVKAPKATDGCGCLWDYAATACLFESAKSVVMDFYGQPLDLNSQASLFMNRKGVIFESHSGLFKEYAIS